MGRYSRIIDLRLCGASKSVDSHHCREVIMRRIGPSLALMLALLGAMAADGTAGAAPHVCISVNGIERMQMGSASCYSEEDRNRAVAIGEDSFAGAGEVSDDIGNTAIAAGPGNTAVTGGGGGGGDHNTAIAAGQDNEAIAVSGDNNTAIAVGTDNTATSGNGNGNTALAAGQDNDALAVDGNDNTAIATGNGCTSVARGGAQQDTCHN